MYRNGSAVDPLSVLKKPQTDGLEAKEKSFISCKYSNIIKDLKKKYQMKIELFQINLKELKTEANKRNIK